MWLTSTDAEVSALDAKLRIASQPKEGDIKKKEGETPKNQSEGETGEIRQ